MRFSQRVGVTPLPEAIKPDAMPIALRNSLWNAFSSWFSNTSEHEFLLTLFGEFWKEPIDSIPRNCRGELGYDAWQIVRERFFSAPWWGVYDLLDFCIGQPYYGQRLGDAVDAILFNELAAYRVIDKQIVPVTNSQEVQALEEAITDKGKFATTSAHLSTALSHLSNRDRPDFRNSIKESISAVESVAKIISGKEKAELGDALAILEKKGKLHGALRQSYSALYGYTSDANGIRHALMSEPDLTAEDAKYFLLACTSFVNYLKTLA